MATLDVLTAAEGAKAVGGTVPASDTALLAQFVTGVSLDLDRVAGPVVRRTITDELVDGYGTDTIFLAHWPVFSITEVTENVGGTLTVLTAEAFGATTGGYRTFPYDADPTLLSGVMQRRSGGSPYRWPNAAGSVKVTYVAGRFADTASVDARFKNIASLWLQYLWRSREPSTITGPDGFTVPSQAYPKAGVPDVVTGLLGDDWQGVAPFSV